MRNGGLHHCAAIALGFAVFIFLVSACGNGQRQLNNISINHPAGADARAEKPAAPLSQEKLDDALAKLEAASCPEGVDAGLWEELKGALKTALKETHSMGTPRSLARLESGQEEPGWLARRTQKYASIPPTTDGSKVTDLAFGDDGTGNMLLTWHYRNAGDYDQNGTVGIPDVTPIAMYYGLSYPPADVNSALAVIDGSGNGVVDIADITPLAMNFGGECAEYALEDSPGVAGPYAEVARATLPEAGDGGRIALSVIHTFDPARPYVRVVPYDSEGAAGVPSTPLKIEGVAPNITSIYPLFAVAGAEQQFVPYATGDAPFYYSWDFGGGAEPSTTSERMPTVTIGAPGEYSATLTVRNIFGSDEVPFTLTTGVPPDITSVTPVEGDYLGPATFSAVVTGTEPITYSWDFGDGAAPNTSTDISPTVTLGEMGDYAATLSVTSKYGSDTYQFNLHVLGWHIELVDDVGDLRDGLSLKLDISGHPHVAYDHNASGMDMYLKYAYKDESGWHIEVVDDQGNVGGHCSLALDSNMLPSISYYDITDVTKLDTGDLNYASYDGSVWTIETVDSEGSSGSSSSLAFDSLDRPHVAYCSYLDVGLKHLKYASYDGASWNTETVDNADWVGTNVSLALNSAERPCIAYHASAAGNLNYAYYDGVLWNIENVDIEADSANSPTLALDSLDGPHITCEFRSVETRGIKYSYKDGLIWQKEKLDFNLRWMQSPSLRIDSQDRPCIAHNASSPSAIMYTRWKDTGWRSEVVDITEGVYKHTSLALDANDRPRICYFRDGLLYYAAFY